MPKISTAQERRRKNKPKLVIVVRGGCVQSVLGTAPVQVELIDLDNRDDEQKYDRDCQRVTRLEQDPGWQKLPY